jgi:hypothetical protein
MASPGPSPRLALYALAALLVLTSSVAAAPVVGASPSDGCRDGFAETTALPGTSIEDVLVTSEGAWAVGTVRQADLASPLVLRHLYGAWAPMAVPSVGENDGLTAVAGHAPDDVWAVGFATRDKIVRPLAMRWDGEAWAVVGLPKQEEEGIGGAFTDVTVSPEGRPWAVGFESRRDGNRPLVARLRDGRWSRVRTPRDTGPMSLTATTISGDGAVWAAGYTGTGSGARPTVLRLRDRRWQRLPLPRFDTESVLTDIAAASRLDVWAVGYEHVDGVVAPLVLRWDGRSWRRVPPPGGSTGDTLLAAVSTPPSGGTWVAGSRWDETSAAFRSHAAWWDGQAWSSVPSAGGGTELHGIDGAPDDGGWVVGRARRGGILSRVCLAPETGLLGGSEPAGDDGTAGDDGPAGGGGGRRDGNDRADRQPGRGQQARRPRARGSPAPLRPARSLKPTAADPDVVARDVAVQSGLAETTLTYSGVVADFDGDGDPDLYIGRHSAPGRLLINDGGVFRDHPAFSQPRADRHGCAAGDVDGSGLPDLLCVVGALRGSGLKANELWLDPGGPDPVEASGRSGLIDPTGRGRHALFLRYDEDAHLDALIANSPTRVDGLPSPSRLFLGSEGPTFVPRPDPGFDPLLGAWAVEAADLDRDGRDELLVVPHQEQVPDGEGVRLYRNTRRGFVDATAAWGVRGIGDRDAHFADLNGDGRPDLVQLSPTRLRVSLWRGRQRGFEVEWERELRSGRALASGDVNGDGAVDLFVLRGSGDGNPADLVLVNQGRGGGFRPIAIPQTSRGDADDVLALDHDGNGLTDFVVLNGGREPGPVQLIAFFPRGSGRAR